MSLFAIIENLEVEAAELKSGITLLITTEDLEFVDFYVVVVTVEVKLLLEKLEEIEVGFTVEIAVGVGTDY